MTTHVLQLAKNLTLPLDAVSRTFGILAVRGAGKSNTAAVMAEEMFAAARCARARNSSHGSER